MKGFSLVKPTTFAFALAAGLACVADTVTAMSVYVLDSTYSSLMLEVEPSDSIDNVNSALGKLGAQARQIEGHLSFVAKLDDAISAGIGLIMAKDADKKPE